MKVIRTNSENKSFIDLVSLLDDELAVRDGKDHEFYHQFNNIDALKEVVVLTLNNEAVGCGAMKPIMDDAMEIKRMYVRDMFRGNGFASIILKELETWAKKMGKSRCVLETGVNQPEAIAMYKNRGYKSIENYEFPMPV